MVIITCGRKGSQRLKNKNMRLLNGKPLIQYTFDVMKKFCFDKWCVTDDENIIDLAKNNGIKILNDPKRERDENWYYYFMEHIKANIKSDAYFMLPPTSPFRDFDYINNCLDICMKNKFETAYTIKKIKDMHYKDSGLFFYFTKDNIHTIKRDDSIRFIDPAGIDIDTISDWRQAEKYIENQNNC